eukprot:511126_1
MHLFALIVFYAFYASDVLGQQPFKIEVIPDSYQNDIEWSLYRKYWTGVGVEYAFEFLDSGSGITNTLATKQRLQVNDTDCLLYNFTDLYGDGLKTPGAIQVYFGQTSIDNNDATQTFSGAAQSDQYKTTGKGGYAGHLEYYIQNGVRPNGDCVFPGQNTPDKGCHETTSVDIIFLLDTSSDLSYDCQNNYFESITELIDDNIPRENLKIAILTYGTDTSDYPATTIINKPLNDNNIFPSTPNDLKPINFAGNWVDIYKDNILALKDTECLGGGHATIEAIYAAINVYTNIYGTSYNNTNRQQYIILFTNEDIDITQTKNKFSCENLQQTLEVNGINFILLSEGKFGMFGQTNVEINNNLKCLQDTQGENNLIFVNYFSKLSDQYGNIEELVCSTKINVAVTEIFIDDNKNRFWIEIINLGVEFNISSLEF